MLAMSSHNEQPLEKLHVLKQSTSLLTVAGFESFNEYTMDQIARKRAKQKYPRGQAPRRSRPRRRPNPLRTWLEKFPPPMRKMDFAKAIGVTPAYVSMLLADTSPWPNEAVLARIESVTGGAVTAAEMIGKTKPGDSV